MDWSEIKIGRGLRSESAERFAGRDSLKALSLRAWLGLWGSGVGALCFLFWIVVGEARQGSFLDGSIHSLDLPVGPRVVWLSDSALFPARK